MKILGITGGTGSGKTTLLSRVAARGGLVIDCDQVYHQLLETDEALRAALLTRFPEAFDAGALNRKKLGMLVFENQSALDDLNCITHNFVRSRVDALLEDGAKHGYALAAVDAIALFESGLDSRCHVTICVAAPVEKRVARLIAREAIAEQYARARISAQKTDGEFGQNAQFLLKNDYQSAADFATRCDEFLKEIIGGTKHE